MRSDRLGHWTASHWFLLLAPALLATEWFISRSTAWAHDAAATEAALLFDATVTMPVLYALCYRRSLPLWQLTLRMVGIACLGIYLVSYLVPPDAQSLLPGFARARTLGMALLILIEFRLFVAGVRLLFKSGITAEQLSAQTGAPPNLARLMLLEARMGKSVARLLRGR